MDAQMITSMFNLIETLAHKESFRGPELMTYLRGLSFAENYFELNTLMLEEQLRKTKDEDENPSRDTERIER